MIENDSYQWQRGGACLGGAAVARQRCHLASALVRADPAPELWAMASDGSFERWMPEIAALAMEQDPIHRHKDVLAHSIAVTARTKPELRIRLAALLHDVGKPSTRRYRGGAVTFHHHEAVGARLAARRLEMLGFDSDLVSDVTRLVELSGRFKGYEQGWTDAAVRRYARDAGHLLGDLNQLVRCDCTTRRAATVERIGSLVDDLELRIASLAVADRRAAVRPLLGGAQIMAALSIEPGPVVGEARRLLLSEQERRPALTACEAKALLLEWWRQRPQGRAAP